MVENTARQSQTREIELELIRVRREADAARLDARAAELELILRRLASGQMDSASTNIPESGHKSVSPFQAASTAPAFAATGWGVKPKEQDGWLTRLARLEARHHAESSYTDSVHQASATHAPPTQADDFPAHQQPTAETQDVPLWAPRLPAVHPTSEAHDPQTPTADQVVWNRFDARPASIQPPHITESASPFPTSDHHSFPSQTPTTPVDPKAADKAAASIAPAAAVLTPPADSPVTVPALKVAVPAPMIPLPVSKIDAPVRKIAEVGREPIKSNVVADSRPKVMLPLPAVDAVSNDQEESRWRVRPASWLVSMLAHAAILLLLGLLTLANNKPKDQLAFTASASESSEESMETFQIESSEAPEPTEPAPTETAYELSAVGTMSVTEVSLDVPPAPAPPTTELFSKASSLSSSAMKSLKSDSNSKIQFCGVDGGGSHFVYLVDSSNSMRDGFQAARTELLNSIDQLKAEQRFYVIFYDESPDFMRISDPNKDEPASVMATPENKQRLRKWASTVEMNKGLNPSKLLPFAINLRSDVIFLLSDGEFPDSVGKVLLEKNHQENLFGESGPISLVHTIRYHGNEGTEGKNAEATMIKIARENGGQYRHVPKPR